MYFPDNIFVIIFCAMCFVCARCQRGRDREGAETDVDEDILPEDHYSFVALIDIVYTNGAKKSCTGTIIHDNVVITAAHCFSLLNEGYIIQPELTASFVVIGTKKMFDTGYEQYLPIERLIIHPKYKGWTADLALVHTFAGMMSDKPGRIVPLATEKTNTPVDSDVTVFSWGQCNDDIIKVTRRPTIETTLSDEEAFEVESKKSDEVEDLKQHNERLRRRKKRKRRFRQKKTHDIPVTRARGRTWAAKSNDRPQSSIEGNDQYKYSQHRYENISDFDSEDDQRSWEKKTEKLDKLYKKSMVNSERMIQKDRRQVNKMMSYYTNNWRRKMGDHQNKLMVEVFGFINMHSCQKIVEKAMPSVYAIKNPHEVLCYASEERYITEDDSGAPAMRRGRLVALTVGGADFDGEHVAVGMKMACFCSWIAENIPNSGTRLQCCKNCCDLKGDEADSKELLFRNPHRKRKL